MRFLGRLAFSTVALCVVGATGWSDQDMGDSSRAKTVQVGLRDAESAVRQILYGAGRKEESEESDKARRSLALTMRGLAVFRVDELSAAVKRLEELASKNGKRPGDTYFRLTMTLVLLLKFDTQSLDADGLMDMTWPLCHMDMSRLKAGETFPWSFDNQYAELSRFRLGGGTGINEETADDRANKFLTARLPLRKLP